MPEFELAAEISLTFEEARVIYLALAEAFDRSPAGSELRIRLDACKDVLMAKFLGNPEA